MVPAKVGFASLMISLCVNFTGVSVIIISFLLRLHILIERENLSNGFLTKEDARMNRTGPSLVAQLLSTAGSSSCRRSQMHVVTGIWSHPEDASTPKND